MLFPKMGIFNTTILELILHAVTAFTYWNFDSLQKRQGQRSEANMERPTGHFEKGVKLQFWQDKLRTSLLLKKKSALLSHKLYFLKCKDFKVWFKVNAV